VVTGSAEPPGPKEYEYGDLIVNGHRLGPARRDPATGVVELGPHIKVPE